MNPVTTIVGYAIFCRRSSWRDGKIMGPWDMLAWHHVYSTEEEARRVLRALRVTEARESAEANKREFKIVQRITIEQDAV